MRVEFNNPKLQPVPAALGAFGDVWQSLCAILHSASPFVAAVVKRGNGIENIKKIWRRVSEPENLERF